MTDFVRAEKWTTSHFLPVLIDAQLNQVDIKSEDAQMITLHTEYRNRGITSYYHILKCYWKWVAFFSGHTVVSVKFKTKRIHWRSIMQNTEENRAKWSRDHDARV